MTTITGISLHNSSLVLLNNLIRDIPDVVMIEPLKVEVTMIIHLINLRKGIRDDSRRRSLSGETLRNFTNYQKICSKTPARHTTAVLSAYTSWIIEASKSYSVAESAMTTYQSATVIIDTYLCVEKAKGILLSNISTHSALSPIAEDGSSTPLTPHIV